MAVPPVRAPTATGAPFHVLKHGNMCGRYALALVSMANYVGYGALELTGAQRPSEVRQQLEQAQMPVEDAPADQQVRQSYNFAPGYHGLVYRAEGPDRGGQQDQQESEAGVKQEGAAATTRYKLQAMQWGAYTRGPLDATTDRLHRPRALLDQAESRLCLQDEDDQLPRRLAH